MAKPAEICECGHEAAQHVGLARDCTAGTCKGCPEFRSPADKGTTGHAIDPRGVNHPKHYNVHPSGIECIDVIEHMTFNIGIAIKHLWRAGLKDGEPSVKDLDKAIWYITRERERIGK